MKQLLILILCLPLLTNATVPTTATYNPGMGISLSEWSRLLLSPKVVTIRYVSSLNGNNSDDGLSTANAWATFSKVQSSSASIAAGDFVLFEKGSSFSGSFTWTKDGTSGNPITFGTYGTGAKPIVQFAGNDIFYFPSTDYTVIDGFNFTDLTFDINDKVTEAPCANGIRLGVYNGTTSNHNIVRNCNFSNIGGAIVINGDFNICEYDTITNMKNVQNTFSNSFPGNDNDYGANPYTITGNDNIIRYNYVSGGWAESEDYGWNGGAFEMFDNCNRNKFLYNTIIDCGGIAEYGAFALAATANDNLYAFNRIINCGNLSWVNTNGTFAMQASNIMYFNNVIIENYQSRFSGPNTGAGIVTPRVLAKVAPEPDMLAFSGTPTASVVYNMRNNIFLLRTGAKIVRSSGVANKTTHQDNVLCNTNTTYGYTIDGSEIATTSQIFKDTSNANPNFWDYHLTPSSPARGIGQNLSAFFSPYIDYEGKVVASPYDVGIYQYSIPVITQLRTRLKFKNSN